MAEGFFYFFSILLITSSLIVVLGHNPVHSVLFLILCFLNAAGMFILLGAEFLSMILIIVYVGAVAVLFLFIVMMLNINVSTTKRQFLQTLPFGLLIGIVLATLIYVGYENAQFYQTNSSTNSEVSNTEAIGFLLYTDYFIAFQLVGIILLIAMIGAIVLAMTDASSTTKKQNISKQIARNPNESAELIEVKSKSGVTL